jgi:hypothetical protein
MVRGKLWFRCAAVHDPVTPMIVGPARIGWEAKKRKIDLTIERPFSGEELVKRMKGWITIDPARVIEVVKQYGKMKVLDEKELVVEMENDDNATGLDHALHEVFGDQIDLEIIKKT